MRAFSGSFSAGSPGAERTPSAWSDFTAPRRRTTTGSATACCMAGESWSKGWRHRRGARLSSWAGEPGATLNSSGGACFHYHDFEVVDLCPALLEQAKLRCARWPDVAHTVEADAALYRPSQSADRVILSYALTMMPDWRAVLSNASAMLRPGGLIGVVDFYVSGKTPLEGRAHHGALARALWPRWFAHDGVHLNALHLEHLCEETDAVWCDERMGRIPFLPGLRAPYYLFIGRKRQS